MINIQKFLPPLARGGGATKSRRRGSQKINTKDN